jgi:putative membrane protein
LLAWSPDPAVLLITAAAALLYYLGLRRRTTRGGSATNRQAWCFGAGLGTLLIALISPIDEASASLFSAHMVQHLLLIAVGAPLLVLGEPATAMLWAFPLPSRRRIGGIERSRTIRTIWHWLTKPVVAWCLATLTLWIWHAAALFEAALRSEPVHALEHFCLLTSWMLFWQVLIERRSRLSDLGKIGYLLATIVQSTALGIALVFSSTPWYATYAARAPEWGLPAATDQQLAGLVMWIPAGTLYLGVALMLMARMLMGGDQPIQQASAAGGQRGE